jgi:type I pullulanase
MFMGKRHLICSIVGLITIGFATGCSCKSNGTGDSGEGSGATSSGVTQSDAGEASYSDTYYTGKVKICYHRDDGAYSNKRLWIWCTGVDGSTLGEVAFDNQKTPDDYGVNKTFDLSSAPWKGAVTTSLSFIVKDASTWDGQSNDTICYFGKFINYLTKDESGNDLMVIYAVDAGNNAIETYAKQTDAVGDRFLSCAFGSDWKTISCVGTGSQGSRSTGEVGLCSSYSLYGFPTSYYLLETKEQNETKSKYLLKTGEPKSNNFTIVLDDILTPSTSYVVEGVFAQNTAKTRSKTVSSVAIYDTSRFSSSYTYSSDDLGAHTQSDGSVVVKVWAPTASRMLLNLYFTGTPGNLFTPTDNSANIHGSYDMTLGEKGVWSYKMSALEAEGAFYTFTVYNSEGSNEVMDPYAYACGVNGQRAAILTPKQWSDTNPEGFSDSINAIPSITSPNQLSIYETHIRDFTADKSWISHAGNRNGTYNAFAESGTTYQATGTTPVTTGLDSLKELGVKAVQILPVFDQDNDERWTDADGVNVGPQTVANAVNAPSYNWGYNPLNYNCVEGAYSSNPFLPEVRIKEYKNLIKTLADNGIRTIMDVVYNHLSSVSNSCFSKIMPKYYFRTNSEGFYTNGSGVGNETATERTMMRKYIVDSVKWWASEYGIKGFRFDLMGCIDTTTMGEVAKALHAIDPQIVVYGEGWTGGGSALDGSLQSKTSNVYSKLGTGSLGEGVLVGCFNDSGRNGLKGDTVYGSAAPDYGFMTKGPGYVTADVAWNSYCAYLGENRNQQGTFRNPNQTLTYVSCHDGYTLYDQLNYCLGLDATADHALAMQASVALTGYVALSQGLAFYQGGEELFRQKLLKEDDPYRTKAQAGDYVSVDGVYLMRNSYMYGDEVNSYKWDRKETYKGYFDKYAEATNLRNSLMGSVTGLSQTMISSQVSPWGSAGSGYSEFATLAQSSAVMCFNNKTSSNEYYIFMSSGYASATTDVSIGSGSLEVVYDSIAGKHSSPYSVTSSFPMYQGELVLLKRV